MGDFDLTITERADRVEVELHGELDISTAVRLDENLERIEADDPALIVLDMRSLDFMDSTGLRIVLRADERARAAGRRLVLVRGNELIQRVLTLTRLDEQLEIVGDPAAIGPEPD